MSDSPTAPQSVDELRKIIGEQPQVIAVGNQTKRPLSNCPDATPVSLREIAGITQYEPSEFTFTAMAGTPLAEIVAALNERQQYLPFDPVLVDAGATLGGTVAAGLSGPGRFRYGGIRDFLLAVTFISGDGKLIRSGGKVVKNAAGFDIPKFLIGSLGRLGVMTELTFKVFPKPTTMQTMQIQCGSHEQALERMAVAAGSTWELDAIDYQPDQQIVLLRIGGPEISNQAIAKQILSRWGSDASVAADADDYWKRLRDLNWTDELTIAAKIPTTPNSVAEFCEKLPGSILFSAAANVAWRFMKDNDQVTDLSKVLSECETHGLVVRGNSDQCQIGRRVSSQIEDRIKHAFDPLEKYPSLERSQTEVNH